MTTTTAASAPRSPGRLFLALGLGIPLLGVLGYVIQFSMKSLRTPWYVPGAATLGMILVILSIWKARSVWRVLALILVSFVAVMSWMFLFVGLLPPYTGPVAQGQTLPAFTTMRSDGSMFTESDLEGGQSSVLVFFRGRW